VVGVLRELDVPRGVDVYVYGEVPNGAGLSSSAALECAVAVAANALFGLGLGGVELALAAQRAENNFVGVPCGIMDQAVSMLAVADHAVLIDCRSLAVEQVPLGLAAADLALLVIDTRAHHELVDGGYAARRSACESAVSMLGVPSMREVDMRLIEVKAAVLGDERFRRSRHAVSEIARVHSAVSALQAGDWVELGRLLNQSHASLRDDYEVSCAELDVAVESAVAVGALGARMVGGGFGGSAVALVRVGLIDQVRTAVQQAYAAAGFKEPRFFAARAADGARLERVAG
jgi:galactokinase